MGSKYAYKPLDKAKAQMLSVPDAAELLGISSYTMYRHIWNGDIPHTRIGRIIRVPRAKIMALIEGDANTKRS